MTGSTRTWTIWPSARSSSSASARLDRARLVAGRAVGLRELHALPVRGPGERGDQLPVGLLRRRVRDQRELAAAAVATCGLALLRGAAAAGEHGQAEHGEDGAQGRAGGSANTSHGMGHEVLH